MATSTAQEVSKVRVAELIKREEDRFRSARPRSHELWNEAREVLPRGVPSSFQDAAPQPVFVDHGQGSRVWDADGNEYVDFHNGFGVMVVGHAHPKIVEVVSKQVARGSHFAQPVEDAVVVAKELSRRFKQPQWRFTNSGTESTLDAVRIARGDQMGPADAPASIPQSEGIPAAVVELTSVIPFNDLAAAEKAFAKHPGEIAAVIVEPAMMNVGIVLPDQGYLAGLRDLAHKHGALLIFDEVKTGVTIAPGGATERFGVVPDLVALAKAIGGGLPCGAVGGRADVMAVIEQKRVAQMGTFNGNPLTTAASRATLLEVLTPTAYAHFDALAETLQGGLDAVIAEHSLPFHVTTLAARGCVTYRRQRVRNYRDYLEIDKSLAYLSWLYQCNRGVLMAPGAEENWTLSVQHSVEDVQRYVDNFAEMARDLRA
ncbi:MAG: aspartate aminotransferase family protein [Chloroflexi bacterium]|nr:MAG: aspartate aminotransferase family protein [Chloroflexota bacterium]